MKNVDFNIVVCASGGGGNFQSIIDARSDLGINISLLMVDRPCGAVERAKKFDIPFVELSRDVGNDFFAAFESAIPSNTHLIVLAGFMPIIPNAICKQWDQKIINTHPSLLPKYGGRGMYGVKVQEAVMSAKERYAGCTVHYVNSEIDGGQIILQKSLLVNPGESPWTLGGRIFQEEGKLLVAAIKLIKHNALNERGSDGF